MHAAKISIYIEINKKNVDYFSFCGQSAYTNTVGTVFLCTKEGYTDSEVTSKSFKVGWRW